MLTRSVMRMLAPALRRAGRVELAGRCSSIASAAELLNVATALETPDRCKLPQRLLSAIEHAADAAAHLRSGLPTDVVFSTFSLMREIAALDTYRSEETWRNAAAILAAVLEIGNQAEPGGADVVAERLDTAKQMSQWAGRRAALAG
jgi:hypothetical protein